jgi:probable O-glycosylation ligase (exosortase A-associated)
MSLRDLLLFTLLLVVVVMTPRRPFIGALGWVLFGVMNPHRLAWGPAYDFPFSQVVALVTLLGLALNKQHRSWKGGAAAGVLVAFFVWSCVTTLFAFQPDPSLAYLSRVMKTFLMTLVMLMLMQTKRDVIWMVGALAFSLAFYGTKGGLFVIATGGQYMVNGPPDSVMDGNNSLGVGLVMVIPLLYFLRQQLSNRWLRLAVAASMLLCSVSVIGAYSRGAMLAIAAMVVLLWFRGKSKLMILLLASVFTIVLIPVMPAQWTAKMNSLEGYEADNSAMYRLYTWEAAYNIAKDRFPVAGGFEWESPAASAKYSLMPTLVLVAHSIYFQVIGSQGFIGLALYLTFWWLVWRQCATLRRLDKNDPELQWARLLGSMVQISLVGYAVGGAFLDLAFWDVPYYLFGAVAAANFVTVDRTVRLPLAPAFAGDCKLARQRPE